MISEGHTAVYDQLILSGAILVLAVAGLVVRFASFRYPARVDDSNEKSSPAGRGA